MNSKLLQRVRHPRSGADRSTRHGSWRFSREIDLEITRPNVRSRAQIPSQQPTTRIRPY